MTAADITFTTAGCSLPAAQGETSAANKHCQSPRDVMTMSSIVSNRPPSSEKDTIAHEDDDEIDDYGVLKMNSSARTTSTTKDQSLHVGATFDIPVSWGADSETSFSMEDSFWYADANSSNVSLDINDINNTSVDHASIDISEAGASSSFSTMTGATRPHQRKNDFTRTPPSRSTSSSTHRRSVSSQGSGRRCPKRGLSASCSSLNFEACEGQALSREQSKLNKLSNRSNQSGASVGDSSGKRNSSFSSSRRAAPPRSGSSGTNRRTMQRPNSLEGNRSSQLQVGDMVLLANKEFNTSSHLKRRMPTKRRSAHAAANGVDSMQQLPTNH